RGGSLVEPRTLWSPVPAVAERLHSAQLHAVQATPGAQPPGHRIGRAPQPDATEEALVDLPRIERDGVGGTGEAAIPGGSLGEDVEIDRAAERLRSTTEQGQPPRVRVAPRIA